MNPPAATSVTDRLIYLARLGRPLHLAGGVIFNGLGIAIALFLGASVSWTAAIWAQIAITSIQLMTHYSNDYYDQDADAASTMPTRWSGGSRVLPDGLLRPRAALVAAVTFGGVAIVAVAALAWLQLISAVTVALFLLAGLLAWSYSSPPLSLNRHGLGEISGALLVPGLTTLIGFMVQTNVLNTLPILAAFPLICFQFAMLLSVNFPDRVGDAQVNKRTLIVIMGAKKGAALFVACLALAYLVLPLLVLAGLPRAVAFAVLLTLPLALWQVIRITRGAATDPMQWNALAFWSIGLLLTSAVFELVSFVVLGRGG